MPPMFMIPGLSSIIGFSLSLSLHTYIMSVLLILVGSDFCKCLVYPYLDGVNFQ